MRGVVMGDLPTEVMAALPDDDARAIEVRDIGWLY